MSRIKVKFPDEKPLFTATIPVRIGDVNYGGHVGNDAILSVIHEARVQFFAHGGMTEMNVGGVGVIMADVGIAYKAESFYKDIFQVGIFATEITNVSFDLLYRIIAIRNGTEIDIAHAKTGMVCFDYDARKVAPVPQSLKSLLEKI